MLAFSLTIFWGACLLFLVQPLMARFILPWFGGGPAVWTSCMLFFQLLLLGGYAYAHFSISRLTPRRQVITHLTLLALAVALLPITPSDAWKPTDGSHATGHILLLLAACLGLPYLVLSATGPLLQAWFSRTHPGVSPYRLYALSNVGSLLALLAYPFWLEPNLSRRAQADGWSWGLGIYALLAAWCGAKVWRAGGDEPAKMPTAAEEPAPAAARRFLWFALPACGVMLLLAITSKLCQDIAVVPFLWVLPLGLYLLSFILSFDSPRWYHRGFWLPLLAVLFALVTADLYQAESHPGITPLAALYLSTLFVACMVCHGEAYRLRPGAGRLTGFYLALSAGGAAGGLFVALLAPMLFPDYFELHLALFLTAALVLAVLQLGRTRPTSARRIGLTSALALLALIAFGYALYDVAETSLHGSLRATRGFYGVLKIKENDEGDPKRHHLTLQHGATVHGLQLLDPRRKNTPTSYYGPTSGVGKLLRVHKPDGGRRVGAVGLGAGTLAAWGQKNDVFRFYEIDPDVVRLATGSFTFLKDSEAKTELVMGDARLSMEREADQRYDLIVLDAFSSDAIPVHLLTLEAFGHYQRHLRADGAIAVHVSNRYLDLHPVVFGLAEKIGYPAVTIDDLEADDDDAGTYGSDWIILTRNPALRAHPLLKGEPAPASKSAAGATYWTDERSDLRSLLSTEEGTFLRWLQEF